MVDYRNLLDADVWNFIEETLAFYPVDAAARPLAEQRVLYEDMALHFKAKRPAGLEVEDNCAGGVPIRIYGAHGGVRIVYAHGGGFVLGGLESHDDVCAEIAAATGRQVISVDYRLAPEHAHPAAYDDVLTVVQYFAATGPVLLAGDSAGGTIMASVCGTCRFDSLVGQVLIYPMLGFSSEEGSYALHANAPLLSREDVMGYAAIRGGDPADPKLNPSIGDFSLVPETVIFAAECDPLHDDAALYAQKLLAAGGVGKVISDGGLVHGWLRARHRAKRAGESFAQVVSEIARLSV